MNSAHHNEIMHECQLQFVNFTSVLLTGILNFTLGCQYFSIQLILYILHNSKSHINVNILTNVELFRHTL